MSPLLGLPVEASELLVGSKRAVEFQGRLLVSPAMLSLMQSATPDELQRLLQSITVVKVPSASPFAMKLDHVFEPERWE